MQLAAWHPTTLTDFPGRVAAVLFTAGCNFRCGFCHNPELVLPDRLASTPRLDEDHVLDELATRIGFIDGVVITGGEPTLHPDLGPFAERLHALGLAVKLDTNGTRPDIVLRLLERGLLDYVAVDAKAPQERYAEFCGTSISPSSVAETIDILRVSDIDFEVRTTVAPGLCSSDVEQIAAWVAPVPRFVLQLFRVPEGGKALLDPAWADRPAPKPVDLREIWRKIAGRFPDGGVRA